jgi:hypothetical protein
LGLGRLLTNHGAGDFSILLFLDLYLGEIELDARLSR